MQILANILITPDGTKLQSYHTHDYKTYIDKFTLKKYMIDGGCDYVRSSCNGDEKYLTVTTDSCFEDIRKYFCWGTRGKDRKQPLTFKPLKELDTDHIEAILDTQNLPPYMRDIFNKELEYRDL